MGCGRIRTTDDAGGEATTGGARSRSRPPLVPRRDGVRFCSHLQVTRPVGYGPGPFGSIGIRRQRGRDWRRSLSFSSSWSSRSRHLRGPTSTSRSGRASAGPTRAPTRAGSVRSWPCAERSAPRRCRSVASCPRLSSGWSVAGYRFRCGKAISSRSAPTSPVRGSRRSPHLTLPASAISSGANCSWPRPRPCSARPSRRQTRRRNSRSSSAPCRSRGRR